MRIVAALGGNALLQRGERPDAGPQEAHVREAAAVLAVFVAARAEDGDRRAFAVAVLGTLAATPVVWMHYYALLFVPIALYRPRFSPIWLAPMALWLAPSTYSEGVSWRILLGLGTVAVVGMCVMGFEGPRLRGRRASRAIAEKQPRSLSGGAGTTSSFSSPHRRDPIDVDVDRPETPRVAELQIERPVRA